MSELLQRQAKALDKIWEIASEVDNEHDCTAERALETIVDIAADFETEPDADDTELREALDSACKENQHLTEEVRALQQRVQELEAEKARLVDVLYDAHAAIVDAICNEDGLDGAEGTVVLFRIQDTLPHPQRLVEHGPYVDANESDPDPCTIEGLHNITECGWSIWHYSHHYFAPVAAPEKASET